MHVQPLRCPATPARKLCTALPLASPRIKHPFSRSQLAGTRNTDAGWAAERTAPGAALLRRLVVRHTAAQVGAGAGLPACCVDVGTRGGVRHPSWSAKAGAL